MRPSGRGRSGDWAPLLFITICQTDITLGRGPCRVLQHANTQPVSCQLWSKNRQNMHHFDIKKKIKILTFWSKFTYGDMCNVLTVIYAFDFIPESYLGYTLIATPDGLFWHLSLSLSLLQAWLTGRCWSRWSEGTVCPAPRGAPSPCTRWWSSAGRRIRTKDPRSSTCSPSWRTISQPQSHSTNLERTYSLACFPQTLRQLNNHYLFHSFLVSIFFFFKLVHNHFIWFDPDILHYRSWYYGNRGCVACLSLYLAANWNMFNLAPPPCCTPHYF